MWVLSEWTRETRLRRERKEAEKEEEERVAVGLLCRWRDESGEEKKREREKTLCIHRWKKNRTFVSLLEDAHAIHRNTQEKKKIVRAYIINSWQTSNLALSLLIKDEEIEENLISFDLSTSTSLKSIHQRKRKMNGCRTCLLKFYFF